MNWQQPSAKRNDNRPQLLEVTRFFWRVIRVILEIVGMRKAALPRAIHYSACPDLPDPPDLPNLHL